MAMFLHVVAAEHRSDYRVWLKFNDGSSGVVDLSQELDGAIFHPLRDKDYFRSFKLVGHTLAWDNGADFAPEFLHSQIPTITSQT